MKSSDKRKPHFGDYVLIEQKRYGVPNQMYEYKVVSRLETNAYVDVPVQSPQENTIHKEVASCIAAIRCGVVEEDVRRFRLADVFLVERKEQDDTDSK